LIVLVLLVVLGFFNSRLQGRGRRRGRFSGESFMPLCGSAFHENVGDQGV